MAEILISVAVKVAEYLVAPIVRPLGYLFNYCSNLDKLKEQVEKMGDARGRLQRDVDEANRQGDEIEPAVQKWLTSTEKIIKTAKELIEDEKAANTSCFNLKLRYQRSRQAKKQSGDIGGRGIGKSSPLKLKFAKNKTVLVILDDIWEELSLENIGIPFGDAHEGCKVLLTSRKQGVLSRKMGTQKNFHVQHLCEEEAWSLFKKTADRHRYAYEWPGVFFGYNDENKPVRMHDVVGDVARAIAAKDPHRFVVIKEALGLEEWQRKEEFRNCSRISLQCRDFRELPERLDTKHVLYELDFLQLKRLRISDCPGIQYIVNSMKGVPSYRALPILEELYIKDLGNMDAVCYGPIPEGSFGKLRSLDVFDCKRLKSFILLPMEQGRDGSVLPGMGSLDSTRDFSSTGTSATQELCTSDVPTPFFNEEYALPHKFYHFPFLF
ncbi:hypothetical protein AAG906_007432 [Vitis piasezkii]